METREDMMNTKGKRTQIVIKCNRFYQKTTRFSLLTNLHLKSTERRNEDEKSRPFEYPRMSGYNIRGSFLRGFRHDR